MRGVYVRLLFFGIREPCRLLIPLAFRSEPGVLGIRAED
jgi:hypothetical protein